MRVLGRTDSAHEVAATNVAQVLAWYHQCGKTPCKECLTIARGAVKSITPKKETA